MVKSKKNDRFCQRRFIYAQIPNQRQRIMALYRMLYENTDSRHGLTMSEILDRLAELEIPSDRRAIYDDIRSLNETFAENPRDKNQFAIQIETTRTNPIRYYLKSREFEIDELKLLVDSVRTYPFITKGQTKSWCGSWNISAQSLN